MIFIFDENQTVTVKWNGGNIPRLKALGYEFTGRGEDIEILAKHLTDHSGVIVNATCDYCGKTYKSSYSCIINGIKIDGTNACSHCAAKKARSLDSKTRSAKHFQKIKKICDYNGYKLLTVDDGHIMANTSILYECPIHGVQSSIVDSIVHGHLCYSCGRESVGDKLRKCKSEVVREIESVDGNKLLNPNDYKDKTTHNLRIRCKCGKEFTTSLNNYVKHGVTKCKSCSSKASVGEALVEDVLNQMCIPYKREYKFDDCVDKRPLPFDFYLHTLNKIIEFDGPQHFKEVGMLNHEVTVYHDKIKNEFCERNNIPILRIPYWERDNINVLINDFLN